MPFNIGPLELIIVLVIALLVLGPGKLPEVGSALGKSIREFRKAASDIEESVRVEATPAPAQPQPPAPAAPVAAPVVAQAPTPVTPPAPDPAAVTPAPVSAPEPNTLSQPVAPNEIAGQPRS